MVSLRRWWTSSVSVDTSVQITATPSTSTVSTAAAVVAAAAPVLSNHVLPLTLTPTLLLTVDYTSVDTRSSEREAATFTRMHDITSRYRDSAIYQSMLGNIEQSLQWEDKPVIPFKSKESPNGAAKLEVLLRSGGRRSPMTDRK